MKNPLFVLLMVILSTSGSFAAVYYVDQEQGNDLSDGTSVATAWKTLPGDPAVDLTSEPGKRFTTGYTAGDRFYLKRGSIYYGNWLFNNNWSGTVDAPLFIGSAPADIDFGPPNTKAIMDGSIAITGWVPIDQSEASENSNWAHFVKFTLNQDYDPAVHLYCDSQMMYGSQAKPTEDMFDFERIDFSAFDSDPAYGTFWEFTTGNYSAGGVVRFVDDRINNLTTTSLINTYANMRVFGNLYRTFLIIDDKIVNGKRSLFLQWPAGVNPPVDVGLSYFRWTLSHHPTFMDRPGTFSVKPDGRTLIAWFPCPVANARITSLLSGVDMRGADNVVIDSVILRRYLEQPGGRSGAGIIGYAGFSTTENVTINNCEATQIHSGGGTIVVNDFSNWTITNYSVIECPSASAIRMGTGHGYKMDGLRCRKIGRTCHYLGGTTNFEVSNLDMKDLRQVHGNGFSNYLGTRLGKISRVQILDSDRPLTTQISPDVVSKSITYSDSVLIGPGGDYVGHIYEGETNSTFRRVLFAPSDGVLVSDSADHPSIGLTFENCVFDNVIFDFDGTKYNATYYQPTFKNCIVLNPVRMPNDQNMEHPCRQD